MSASTTHPDPVIRKLPALLVNQIAAGEVIERPASVVKELVENAIDAGATRIAVDLEGGGIELVRVSDDGCGIGREQLALALSPHATSKIIEAGDLDRIATMGFRGEALASIASVSRLTIRSRARTTSRDQKGAEHTNDGALIEASGSQVSPVKPAAGPVGTTVEVRNLFFNTPARRKFLRTERTEQTRCMEWLRDLALAHPAIGFRVTGDGKVKLDLSAQQSPRQRVLAILGPELEEQLVEVHHDGLTDDRGVSIWGLIGLPAIARATAKAQHVFLNGRTIRDRTISHALREGYRGLIEPGRHPTGVLMLEMTPAGVDVNVHPAKLEVRFRDQSMIHSVVLRTVREALMRADLTPTVLDRLPGAGAPMGSGLASGGGGGGISPERFADCFKRDVPGQTGGRLDYDALRAAMDPVNDELRAHEAAARQTGLASPGAQGWSPLPEVKPVDRVLQVHNSYLVTQDEHGVVIVDQHALHERVMFEKLLTRVTGGGQLESQALLTPAVVEADPALVDRLGELRMLLGRIGIEADAMGPRAVGVRAFPSFLFSRGVEPVGFMTELLTKLDRGFAPESEEALHEVLDMMACKAAVKAGDALSDDEMIEIMSMRTRVERSGSCPHGRPTTVRLTIAELEKLFDRR